MFTGIVQTSGVVRSIQRGSSAHRLVVDAPALTRPITDGASIAVNGICLTVVHSDAASVAFDVVPETFSRSTMNTWSVGRTVNLEPSLRAGDGMDGHIVQGHIDGIARVTGVDRGARGHLTTFSADDAIMPYIIPKGSVALDGVSLTIAGVQSASFTVALIPTTLAGTTLDALNPGDAVNVETDIVARTIVTTLQRMREAPGDKGITMDMLKEQGYV